MALKLEVSPAVEPVSVAEVKERLKVEHTDEDILIAALIASARAKIELRTKRNLITQEWTYLVDSWPQSGVLHLPLTPVQSLVSVSVTASDQMAQPVDLAGFELDGTADRPRLGFNLQDVPRPGVSMNGIAIRFRSGYGDIADYVPSNLREAIYLLVAHWYENREPGIADGMPLPLPGPVETLMAPFRVMAL